MRPSFRPIVATLIVLVGLVCGPRPVRAELQYDRTRYMAVDEIRPGMKGYGLTVMSGTKIERFNVEVISVMTNAWYARQDIILVRCSGLNLEHSGIIGGMSGSPCFLVDDAGRERMIGAIAYGWPFNKDPVGGVQPIMQMLDVAAHRAPGGASANASTGAPGGAAAEAAAIPAKGIPIGELIARNWRTPLPEGSRLSIFNDDIAAAAANRHDSAGPANDTIRPLTIPVMMSGLSPRTMELLGPEFERRGLLPVASGGAGAGVDADQVKLEPGSVICVSMMLGDLHMEALGTCTEVIGDKVLGFGHQFFADGAVQLPVATGMINTVISSVQRSNKMGAVLRNVGTLYGDETTAIFGMRGEPPAMIPMEIKVRDIRGEQVFHFQGVQEETFTALIAATAVSESALSHSVPPREHTIRYTIDLEFDKLGAFRTTNTVSQDRMSSPISDTMIPIGTLMAAPFGEARLTSLKADITIEEGARLASMEKAFLPRSVYKPGETVRARVRWFHYRSETPYSEATYDFKLPDDLPDGDYPISIGSAAGHLKALQAEKPYLFAARNLPQALEAFNRLGACAENKVYMRLRLPEKGLAVNRMEMPELPSYRARIYASAGRSIIHPMTEALVVEHPVDFVVRGEQILPIKVRREGDQ